MDRVVKSTVLAAGSFLALCLLMWAGASAASEWKKPPFDLPFEDFLPIPDGRGVSFFHDVWVDYSGRQGGGPLTIKADIMANYDSSPPVFERPYRVLYTGPNYVLFLTKFVYEDGVIWTDFGVFLLQNGPVLLGNPYTSLLRHWMCTDYTMRNGEAYDWSIEKIEETFWSGWCAKDLSKPYEEWHRRPEHWSSFIYNRQRD